MLDQWIIEKHEEPWPYMVIDNFYDEETWNYIQYNIVHNCKKYFTQWPERWGKCKVQKQLTYGPLDRVIVRPNRLSYEPHEDSIITNYFLKHTGEDFIKKYFKTYRSYTQLKPYVSVKYAWEQGQILGIHDETSDKVLSVITYLSPQHNIGTMVYDKNKNLKHTTPWKQNRAFVMCGIDGVTWHNCISSKSSPSPTESVVGNASNRITIDYFATRPNSEISLPMHISK